MKSDLRKKIVMGISGILMAANLRQQPECFAEEIKASLDVPPVSEVKIVEPKNLEYTGDRQDYVEIYDMNQIQLKDKRTGVGINRYLGETGIKEFIRKNPNCTFIAITTSPNLKEFKSLDEVIELESEMTLRSSKFGELSFGESDIYEKRKNTRYVFDDSKYGKLYHKIAMRELERVYKDTLPEEITYSTMSLYGIRRLEVNDSDLEGLKREEVLEFLEYMTTVKISPKVSLMGTNMKFSLSEVPPGTVLGVENITDPIIKKYGEFRNFEVEHRENVFIGLDCNVGIHSLVFDATPEETNELISYLIENERPLEYDWLQEDAREFLENLRYENNLESKNEYSYLENQGENEEIENIFEDEKMSVRIDENIQGDNELVVILKDDMEV